ncbi:hypothetical protein [Actinomadura miaoliensis]|uniref:hypothetical protein n=1 Tax=Actinomadura miaoliensis TaxID=430685 RepID=UPI0031EE9F52
MSTSTRTPSPWAPTSTSGSTPTPLRSSPKTLSDYWHLIERYVKPHIGGMRLQSVRPARITKLYRDLISSGGRSGRGLSPRTACAA